MEGPKVAVQFRVSFRRFDGRENVGLLTLSC